METPTTLISSPAGTLAVLCAVAAVFFLLEQRTGAVPVSILLGYAMGNYLAPLTGQLARIAAGQ